MINLHNNNFPEKKKLVIDVLVTNSWGKNSKCIAGGKKTPTVAHIQMKILSIVLYHLKQRYLAFDKVWLNYVYINTHHVA